jgi:uncharacterized protein YaeQ
MLYRFQIELSDIDRNVYETLDFRAALHPSEAAPYLLTRVLAYAMSTQEGLDFSPGGLGDPEAPALKVTNMQGGIDHWIEIGNPSARKLHKAGKTAKKVSVFTYKNPEVLLQEIRGNDVHRASEIEIYAFDAKFLDQLENHLEKNNRWSLLKQQGQIDVTVKDETITGEVKSLSV